MSIIFVLLKTEPSQMEKVQENIKEIKGVEEAHMVFGTYDICAKVTGETMKNLKDRVQKIRSQEDVKETLSLIVVK